MKIAIILLLATGVLLSAGATAHFWTNVIENTYKLYTGIVLIGLAFIVNIIRIDHGKELRQRTAEDSRILSGRRIADSPEEL